MRQHVYPKGDAVEHEMSGDCVCGPTLESVGGEWVVVHHSLDGREYDEDRDEGIITGPGGQRDYF